MTDYPECERLAAVRDKSQCIGEFIEWLHEQKIELQQYRNTTEGYYTVRETIEQLLARFFEIDLNKVEDERRAMLEELSAKHN